MISVVAKMPVKAEAKEEALKEIKKLMAKVAKEKGTLHYSVNIEQDNPSTLVFMERYKDMQALGTHGSSPYFQEFIGKSASFMAGPMEIVVMDEILSIK